MKCNGRGENGPGEDMAEVRAFRHEACDAMGVRRNTRFVTCVVHGESARIENVYAMNNWEFEAGGGVRCESSHPYCFAWCDRMAEAQKSDSATDCGTVASDD